MSLRGYSLNLVLANRSADPKHIGVRLGRACIALKMPVSDIAKTFGVSRMTVYSWFTGISMPRKDKIEQIEKFLSS